jgi:hypothetical protein
MLMAAYLRHGSENQREGYGIEAQSALTIDGVEQKI